MIQWALNHTNVLVTHVSVYFCSLRNHENENGKGNGNKNGNYNLHLMLPRSFFYSISESLRGLG